MAWFPLATRTVIRLRAPLAEQDGDQVSDWSRTPDWIGIDNCLIQPAPGPTTPGEVSTDLLLIAPPGADITDADRIGDGADVYAIVGPVRTYDTGVLDHLEATLHAVTTT